MPEIANRKTRELEDALWEASEQGKYPVLCDQSPCLHRMRDHIKKMHLYEPVEFIHDLVAPTLEFTPIDEAVTVHVTCTMRHMGLGDKVIALAKMCSRNVIVPEEVGCCGFAGDKGFTHPDLNKYALRKLRPQLEKAGVKLLTLTNYEAVLEVALQTGYINEEDIPVLNAWRKDPAQWGK